MILGIGLDIVDVENIRRSLERHGERFTARIFSQEERDFCSAMPDPATHYAARFAAREAFIKAAGGVTGLRSTDISVGRDEAGRPAYTLTGAALEALRGGTVHLSMSHEKNTAAAVAVIESKPEVTK